MGIIWMNILLGGGPRQALMALIHPYLLLKGSPVVLHILSTRQAAGCWQPGLSPRCRTAQSSLPALAPLLPGTSVLLTSVNEIVQQEGGSGTGHWWHEALPAGGPSAQPCRNPSQLSRGKETSEQLSFCLCRLPRWLAGALRSSECLQTPNPRQVVLCDQCLARPLGHKPPALTHLLQQKHRSLLCSVLQDAVAIHQPHDHLPGQPSSPRTRAGGGRGFQKGVIFERMKSSLPKGMRQCMGRSSPAQSSRREKKVQLGDLKNKKDPIDLCFVLL